MKIYRCIVGALLVLFLAIGVWYVYSNVYERRSTDDGILIFHQKDIEEMVKGEEAGVTGHGLCESFGQLYCL